MKATEQKTAKICKNGMIKYYLNNKRDWNHPTGFYFSGAEEWLKNNGFIVIR